MSMTKPKYVYDKVGSVWYIFEMEYIGKSSYGNKCPEPYYNEQEVETETYRLNGWELKTK